MTDAEKLDRIARDCLGLRTLSFELPSDDKDTYVLTVAKLRRALKEAYAAGAALSLWIAGF